VNGGGTLAVLEAVRRFSPKTKVYHAATSEMFGNSCDSDGYQRETTHMSPVSPYGCAKLYAHNLCHNYRNAYGMFICSGILFNHESPRRGINFVTNKVALQAAKIKLGMANELVLGNLRAKRDWGHAKDYVRGMWNMLQMPKADDYVLATGYAYSVEDMVEFVFEHLGMDYRKYVKTDKKYERPEELHYLRGDASKAKRDGHDNAFIGFMWRFGENQPIAAYSQKKIINNLMEEGMTFDEAVEYFEFNIIGAWVGAGTPCFIEDMTIEEAKERVEEYEV